MESEILVRWAGSTDWNHCAAFGSTPVPRASRGRNSTAQRSITTPNPSSAAPDSAPTELDLPPFPGDFELAAISHHRHPDRGAKMKTRRLFVWCAGAIVLCALGSVARGAILVLNGGTIGEGRVISRNERDVVFVADGTSLQVHLPLNYIAKLVETDEHGGDVSLIRRPRPRWNVPREPLPPQVLPARSGPTYYLIPLHGEVGATILANAIEKSLADAILRKPTVVVLDIDS